MKYILSLLILLSGCVSSQSDTQIKCQKIGNLAETSMKFAISRAGVEQAITSSFQLYPNYPRELITYEVPIAFYTLKEINRTLSNQPSYTSKGEKWNEYLINSFRQSRQQECMKALR